MTEQEILVPTRGGRMRTFVARPETSSEAPLVVVYQDAIGIREDLRDVARRLAAHGYVAALPDLYYRWGENISFDPVKLHDRDEEVFPQVVEMSNRISDSDVMDDTRSLLDHFADDPQVSGAPRGCMGLCMGGRLVVRALEALPDDLAAGSSLHPSFLVVDGPDSPHRNLANIRGELYLGYGEDDQAMPTFSTMPPMRDALQESGVVHAIDVHPGAEHGYMLPGNGAYQEAAAEASWVRTVELFDRTLKAASAPSGPA